MLAVEPARMKTISLMGRDGNSSALAPRDMNSVAAMPTMMERLLSAFAAFFLSYTLFRKMRERDNPVEGHEEVADDFLVGCHVRWPASHS